MAELDSFVKVTGGKATENPFITLRDRSITFSKSAVEALEYAEYVDMYIDEEGKRAAFKACDKYDGALPFYRPPKKGRPMLVRISDKKRANILTELAGIESSRKGIRYSGRYNEEEKILIIDMKKGLDGEVKTRKDTA